MRYALIVGIDKYDLKNSNLNGCVNDARDVYNTLTKYDYIQHQNIVMLLDHAATKKNIIDHLSNFVSKLSTGDSLVYYHSGHGVQVADKNGDEVDGYDEALVTHDFKWNDPFTDDILRDILKDHPTDADIYLIFDTCYSGGFEMNEGDNTSRTISSKTDIKNININRFGVKQKNTSTQRHLLLSGCRESQYSYETKIGAETRGLMTFNLCEVLKNRNGKIKWSRLFKKIINKVKRATGSKQIPTLVATRNLKQKFTFRF